MRKAVGKPTVRRVHASIVAPAGRARSLNRRISLTSSCTGTETELGPVKAQEQCPRLETQVEHAQDKLSAQDQGPSQSKEASLIVCSHSLGSIRS